MKHNLITTTAALGAVELRPQVLITGRPDDVVLNFPNPTVAGSMLPACTCVGRAPTYPVFRATPHLPGCPCHRD